MEDKDTNWLDSALMAHNRLTESVVIIIENLLKANNIDYLTVTGRTKDKKSALEKINRKSYKNPKSQMTDLSGIRIILYFESDINKVSELISDSFDIDFDNSLDKSKVLSKDQIGYRSVHYVCTLGQGRSNLPEYLELGELKFEVQVRTILQHAWAELAHDSSYKFSGTLPPEIERKLYLYAGMLEIADKGFDEISAQIDSYKKSVDEKSKAGDYSISIDSISLSEFFNSWASKNNINITSSPKNTSELIQELSLFGIKTLAELNDIIPKEYATIYNKLEDESNILGVIRDWMLINDWKKFINDVSFNWALDEDSIKILRELIENKELKDMIDEFKKKNAFIIDD
ncbi:GTP pyrophosphokinase [Photobacterium leiognathi]|uniref:GTP pyrophosphokinase n=3 Tax=Photobacterium TaxID=657 RepID=UPI002736CA33|nr:GTP pyrophosphokinase [Photobacterium leiognathi]